MNAVRIHSLLLLLSLALFLPALAIDEGLDDAWQDYRRNDLGAAERKLIQLLSNAVEPKRTKIIERLAVVYRVPAT